MDGSTLRCKRSSGHGGWPKKSKLAVEEGAAMAIEDGFNKANGSCSDTVDVGLGYFGSDGDGDEEQNL